MLMLGGMGERRQKGEEEKFVSQANEHAVVYGHTSEALAAGAAGLVALAVPEAAPTWSMLSWPRVFWMKRELNLTIFLMAV